MELLLSQGRILEQMNTEIAAVWRRFQCDVTVATNTLIYTLYGISLVHRQAEGLPPNSFPGPDHPPLKVLPHVSKNTPFSDAVAPGGRVEQSAFKAWVVEVYSIWGTIYRGKLHTTFKTTIPSAIRPETDVLGDLGYIRTDLVHRKGVGSKCAKCKVLKWFTTGEQIRLTIQHVLDFLNQMGWLPNNPIRVNDERVILWLPFREQWTRAASAPSLISLRPIIDDELPTRYGVSIVFEDGIFARVAIDVRSDNTSLSDSQWMSVSIDAGGNLNIPPRGTITAETLYSHCFGPSTTGPGMFSLAFKFG